MSHNVDYDEWIAQGYRNDAKDAEGEAEDLLRTGEEDAAADKFEEAAGALREYEEYTGNSRSDDIERLEQKAHGIRGPTPTSASSGDESDSTHETDFGEESEKLRSRAESLIETSNVDWNDIGGHEETKEQICHEIGLGAVSVWSSQSVCFVILSPILYFY